MSPLFNPLKDHVYCQAPNAIVMEDRVRIYYTSRHISSPTLSEGFWVDMDKDLKSILDMGTQPILSKSMPGCFDDCGTYPISVMKHNDTYMAYYGGWTHLKTVPFDISIGMAISSDGKTFARLGNGPVLTKSIHHQSVITSPKIRHYDGFYYLYCTVGTGQWINGHPIYKLHVSMSSDGVAWGKLKPLIDHGDAQACPDVFYFKGIYHLFYCHRKAGNGNTDYRISHAIANSPTGEFKFVSDLDLPRSIHDNQCQAYPNVFNVDDKVFMLYNGNKVNGILFKQLKGDLNEGF